MITSYTTVAFYKAITQKLDEVCFLVTAQHQVYTFYMCHLLRLQLGIAARHHDKGAWILAHQPVDGLPALMVSHLRHRTRIDETDVSLLTLFCRLYAHLLKHLAKGRRLREIQLAA